MNLVISTLIVGAMVHATQDSNQPSESAKEPRPIKVRFAPLEVPQDKSNPKAAMREARNVGYLEGREHPPLYLRPLPDGGFIIEHYAPPAEPTAPEVPR